MATCAKIRENWMGLILGCVVALIVFLFGPNWDFTEAIRAIPQITTCIFGFLLTLLGVILQGNSPIISMMRNEVKIYDRFIGFNKRIVILSFVLTILAFVAGYLDFSWLNCGLLQDYPTIWTGIKKMVIALLALGMVWLIVDLMTFIKLFYMLVKQTK